MRKVVTNMLVSIHLPVLFLDCNGRVFTLYFAHNLFAGSRVLSFFIIIWTLQYLAPRVRLVFPFLTTSMIAKSVSF